MLVKNDRVVVRWGYLKSTCVPHLLRFPLRLLPSGGSSEALTGFEGLVRGILFLFFSAFLALRI